MKYKILFLTFVYFLKENSAVTVGNCDIPELAAVAEYIDLGVIKDVETYSKLYSFQGNLEVTILDQEEPYGKYLEVSIEESNLKIATSQEYEHLEEDLADVNTSSSVLITKSISLTCIDGDNHVSSNFTIKTYISDTNNHEPQFKQKSFEFILPSPLLPKIDLTVFGDEIIAKDIDLSFNKISFSTDNSNFVVESETTEIFKETRAILKVQKLTTFDTDVILTIIAEDNGDPSMSNQITVTLKKDSENSLPPARPQFTSSLYNFVYSESNGNPSIDPDGNAEISLDYTELDKIIIKLSDETYVEAEYDSTTGKVTIKSNGTPMKLSSDPIKLLTLSALDNSNNAVLGETIIAIKLPLENTLTIPTFKSSYYEAKYIVNKEDKDTVELASDIEVSENAEVTLEGDAHFALEKNSDDTFKLIVKDNLDPTTVNKGGDIPLVLTASVKNDDSEELKGFATIIVQLPEVKQSPQFTQPHYSAEYKDNDVTVLDGPIKIKSDTENVEIAFSESTPYFDITKGDDQTWNLVSKDPIPPTEKELVLTLQATIPQENVEPGESTLIITINKPNPKFSALYYTATYKTGDNEDSVEVDGDITVEADSELLVNIQLESTHSNYFSISCDSGTNKCEIGVKEKLPPDFWKTEDEIILNIIATIVDTSDVFSAVLVIKPQENKSEIPTFSESYYAASYTESDDGTSNIEMKDQPITITSPTDQKVTISLDGPYSDKFKVVPNGQSYDIQLEKEPLDDTVLISEPDIVLVLIATVDGIEDVGKATLVIQLPKETAPASFSQEIYKGTYKINGNGDPVIELDTIELQGKYIDETHVVLNAPSDLDGYFKISSKNPYTLSVEKKLESAYINSHREIFFTIDAQFDNGDIKNTATLVITLPEPPTFSNDFYTAIYKKNGDQAEVVVDDPQIQIGDEPLPVTVKNSKDFEVKYDDKNEQYFISVINSIEPDEFPIYLVLDAGVDSAVVIIRMETKSSDVVPKFSKIYYEATYNDDDTITINVNPITIVSEHAEDTVVQVVDTFASNFETKINTDKSWDLQVKDKLSDDIMNENEIIVSLEASLPDSVQTGTATLIITLPNADPDHLKAIPRFNPPQYTMDYKFDDPGSTSPVDITIESSQPDYVQVTLSSYSDNFNINRDKKNSNIWHIELNKPFDENVDENVDELVIPLLAHLDGSVADGNAVLVVNILKEEIQFEKSLYNGSYIHDKSDEVTIEPIIVTKGADVSVIGDYNNNFKISCKDDGICELTVDKPLEDSILNEKSEIFFVVEALKPNVTSKATATVILSLPLHETLQAPEFTDPVYVVKYTENDGKPSVDQTQINVKGDRTGVVVTLSGDYHDYFEVKSDVDHWEIIAVDSLPANILNQEISILLTLVAEKDSVTVKGKAGLVIELPKGNGTTVNAPEFDQVIYIANYEQSSESDTVKLSNGPIKIKGTTDLTAATLEITDTEYKEFFDLNMEDDHWNLSLLKPLPREKIEKEVSLPLTLIVTIDGLEGETALIIILPKKFSLTDFSFEYNVYIANYNEDGPSLEFSNNISLIGNVNNSISVSLSGDNKDFFNVQQEDETSVSVTLNEKNTFPDDILETSAITVDLVATNVETNEMVTAAVVVKLPKESSTFYFSKNFYEAKYIKANNSLISGEKITIKGDPDNTAKITLSGDYKDNFDYTYKDNEVTITLKKALPEKLTEPAITLTIKAINDGYETDAAFIIEVLGSNSGGDDNDDDDDDSNNNKTALIAAVAVLAVLLVASLVGSAVFYFLKFRKDPNLGKFNKNSSRIHKFEHPKRRPTGVIKIPLENDDIGETTTDGASTERRKSVQFDTVNIDELEIEKAEEVEDHDYAEVETPNNDDKSSNHENDAENVPDSDSDQNEDGDSDDLDRRISKV